MSLLNETRGREKKRVLTTDVLFHLQFTGTCIFHSRKQLICRFIQSRAGTALDGSILAACFRERNLAKHVAVQGSSQSQPQILCPRCAKRPIIFFFFSESVLFSPDSVPVWGQERFPLPFVAHISHVLHMGWPGLTFGLLPAPRCCGSQWSVQPGVASPPPCFGGIRPATDRVEAGFI